MLGTLDGPEHLRPNVAAPHVPHIAPGSDPFCFEAAFEILGESATIRPRIGDKDAFGRDFHPLRLEGKSNPLK